MTSIFFTKFLYVSLYGFIFIVFKTVGISALKNFYLRSISRIGNVVIHWILEHEELDAIGMECYWRHPIFSTVFFLAFAMIPIVFENWIEIFLASALILQLFFIGWIDAATGYIPNFLSYILIITAGFFHCACENYRSLWPYFLATLLGCIFLCSINKCAQLIYKKNQIGEGDILFFAGINAWLGYRSAFVALFLGNFLALLSCIFFNKTRLRYAPYLAYGALLMIYLPQDFLKIIGI